MASFEFAEPLQLNPEFRRCVERYRGEGKVHSFSCLNQLLALAFAQLTHRESLRDIEPACGACRRGSTTWAFAVTFREVHWPRPTNNAIGASNPVFK